MDREARRRTNDVMMAFRPCAAPIAPMTPILAMARAERRAMDVLAAYRDRLARRKAQERRAVGLGVGIV